VLCLDDHRQLGHSILSRAPFSLRRKANALTLETVKTDSSNSGLPVPPRAAVSTARINLDALYFQRRLPLDHDPGWSIAPSFCG